MNIIVLDHPRIASVEHFNDIANTPLWSCLLARSVAANLQAHPFLDGQQDGQNSEQNSEQPVQLKVEYLDHATAAWSFAASLDAILARSPQLIAINAVYLWEHSAALFRFCEKFREAGFNGHLNLFGFFPSLVPNEILSAYSCIDSVAVGECEHTLAELASALSVRAGGADEKALHAIAGLATRRAEKEQAGARDGAINYVVRPVEKNPDVFAFPLYQPPEEGCTVTILASRGCYNRCSFCLVPAFDQSCGGWRGRTPENILEEMGPYLEAGCTDFYFSDPNFVGPGKAGRARTLRLMELIRPFNITFGMETRPNDLDDEILEAMVASGLTSLLLGVESGSQAQLRQLNKHATADDASAAIALCRKHGVEPEIGFLMFTGDASLEELEDNLEFLRRNDLLSRLDRTANLLCHRQIILRGTSGYADYLQRGRLRGEGLFEVEGYVPFLDDEVAGIADRVLFACHSVLRTMSDPDSPVYWQDTDPLCASRLNSFLVGLFSQCLTRTKEGMALPEQSQLLEDIRRLLGTSSAPV